MLHSKNYYIKKIAFHNYFDPKLFRLLRLMTIDELKEFHNKLEKEYKLYKIFKIIEVSFYIAFFLICIDILVSTVFS